MRKKEQKQFPLDNKENCCIYLLRIITTVIEKSGKFRDFWCMIRTFSGMIRTSVPEGCPMMRLTPLSLAANTVFSSSSQ